MQTVMHATGIFFFTRSIDQSTNVNKNESSAVTETHKLSDLHKSIYLRCSKYHLGPGSLTKRFGFLGFVYY